MKRAAVLLLLAACGGKAPAPKPAPTSDAERTLVANAEALQAAVCACEDDECLDATIGDRWAATFQTPPVETTITDDGAARFARAYLGTQACIEAVYGKAGSASDAAAAVAEIRELADRACACEDAACVASVLDDVTELRERHANTRADDADIEQFTAEHQRMSACSARWAATTGLSACDEYVVAMERYLRCDTIPQATRDAARAHIETMKDGWADLASLSDDVKQQASEGCRQATEALRQGGAQLGCPL